MKPLPEPTERAIYLNSPQKLFSGNCIGRDGLLKEVFDKIVDGKDLFFKRKCIAIKGEEGIGKTLFCYTLFQYYLKSFSVYLRWIECNGKQSIYDIIKTSFENSQFYRKSKDNILSNLSCVKNPCILFVDQIDQYTPIKELEEISHCPNVILVLSGVLRNIYFADYSFSLPRLSRHIVCTIFERYAREEVKLMDHQSRKSVKCLLKKYARGNPFLVIAFADAKCHYGGKWENVLESLQRRNFDEEDYFKNILKQLYKISELNNIEKSTLSKLATIQYTDFTGMVFELLNIPYYCINSLCNTYWLKQKDSILYTMNKIHRDVISEILPHEINLENAISSFNISLSIKGDKGFKWVSLYVEDLLKKIRGYAVHIMKKEVFLSLHIKWLFNIEKLGTIKKRLYG